MKNKFVPILAMIFSWSISVDASISKKSQDARFLYDSALKRFEALERENAHAVSVNGITMGYLDFGPKNGVPLIWAPGSGWTGYEILNVKDGLIEEGYRVIAIDYRGHGKTQITDYNISIYDMADDVVALMDHLFISKAILGGWSYGGWVATAVYDEYPDRVLGLLLEDGGSSSHQQHWDERPDKEGYVNRMEKNIKLLEKKFDTQFEAFLSMIGADVSKISIDSAVNILSKFIKNGDGKWAYHVNLEALSGGLSGFESNAPSRHGLMLRSKMAMIPEVIFRSLNVPVHIIDPVSENDAYPVSHQNRLLKNEHPDLIVHETYEDTSHAVHLDNPKRFVESASAILKRAIAR